jgi:hypothetical protein
MSAHLFNHPGIYGLVDVGLVLLRDSEKGLENALTLLPSHEGSK